MLAIEQKTAREQSVQLQVFATDMSDQMLMRAREGVYPSEVAASVSTARLERFFEQHAGHYQVRREVRDVVVFASHNLFRDPPYSHLDLIVCRNLLPDLQPEVRQGVLRLFHYALEPHGMLVVGTDEEIEEPELFVRQDGASIYRRKTGPRQPLQLPLAVRPFGSEPSDGPPPLHPMAASRQPPAIVHRQAMERYMPASVLVDAANKIVHYSTSAWMFLQIPGGELTHDVVRLVREPLRVHLENGLGLVRGRDLRSWTSEPVTVETEHGQRHLTLRIEAVVPLDVQELVLVIFDEFAVARPVKTPDWLPDGAAVSVVNRLGAGLQQANDRLRAIVDSDEEAAGAAAAAATNPPGNGELRAVLEELESSREELQAVNEELISLDRDNRQRIEELAQLSSDLHHLLQSTGIATLFLDAELRIVRFTPPIGDLFHIRYTDIGRLVSDLTHDLYYDRFVDDARRVLEDHSTVEQEVDSASGRSFLTRMLPYRTAGDRVDGVVITLVDITARRRAEIELRVADRRKDEFLAVLAHELRNPLAPLSSGVELLKVVGREADIVSKVTPVMARQVRQLVRMVDDLLEVSRISGGRLQLRRSPVLLRGIVRDAVASVRSQVERARQDLEVKVPDVPIVLDADAARLTQVLTNLLNNASKYTPDRGRLTLSAGVDGANAVVTVRDTGYGMPEDVASHVFEMFYRGADSRPRDSGLGIGLTIAKQLVEMHGGTLTVESAGRDLGSTFTMSIPLSSEAQLPASDEKTQNDELGGHRVLIVDDNVDAAEMLGMQVRTLGSNEVRTALSGEVALQTAPAFRPDIVLLDLGMPEMDGFEVARRIRQEPWGKDVMLVAVTGWGQEEHRQRTRDAGFDRHLTKPADPTDIESLLAHSSAPS
jgi:two-component system CheB/CheR fusion protein